MSRRHLIAVASVGVIFFALALSSTASADKTKRKETCESKYPNAPTEPPSGYLYKNEPDAYTAMRREARKAGYTAIKKAGRADVKSGPCVEHGEHLNMKGTKPIAKGKKRVWVQIGSITSCEICEQMPRGPRLYKTVWRIHLDI